MCDPAGVHITRIYVNSSRQSPSPIRSTKTVPVCTSTPIITNNPNSSIPSPKQQAALLAKEILASQRLSSETFIQKPRSYVRQSEPEFESVSVSEPEPEPEPEPVSKPEQFVFISKETGQNIDFMTGEGIGKIKPETGTLTKKKKQRQSLAVVPPTVSARSSKSSDDGDYLVPLVNDMQISNEKQKTNFTSYNGIQTFTFTLDDD